MPDPQHNFKAQGSFRLEHINHYEFQMYMEDTTCGSVFVDLIALSYAKLRQSHFENVIK